MSLKTPVAFLIFNRPQLTERVFEEIARAKPQTLLVVADGPRFPEEKVKCQEARSIAEKVDWNCEVLRNYSETNMGCKRCVSSGLDWVFSQVEEAIVLEDDCLPAPSFFHFCEVLLEKYRDDERIMMISGDNYQDGQKRGQYSYYFSKYPHIWGWASWRRSWRYYDVDMKTWPEYKRSGLLHQICESPYEEKRWIEGIEAVLRGELNTWDTQWAYACAFQNGLSIVPSSNLVSNIGYGPDATNTRSEQKLPGSPTSDIWEITHPPFVVRHRDADAYIFENFMGGEAMKKGDMFRGRLRRRLSAIKRLVKSWL